MAICRVCKKEIDKVNGKEGIDWVMPSRNYYYHVSCYEDWKKSTPTKDEEWVDFIYDFISRDLKVSYDFWKCEAQRKKFLKEYQMTNKGIFFCLKYFYDVKKGDWNKGHGGMGIIPYVYSESCEYWVEQEYRNKGIVARIEEQMREAAARPVKVVKRQERKKKFEVNLSQIGDMEDEE